MDVQKKAPKKIRPASTVILVREQTRELQVYLLKRSTGMGFFPGSYVFPGGALDPGEGDAEFWQHHVDRTLEELVRTFGQGLDAKDILAYGVAAIRETFEEAGVFLAGRQTGFDESLKRICELRFPGKLTEGWLKKQVLDEGWVLSFSNLFPWSHWITPEAMPKRFDTRFFMALMPEGQACVPDDQESVHGLWISPEKGLQGNMREEIPLSPPTVITLHELLRYGTLESLNKALRSRSWGNPILPILMKLDKGAVLVEPWDPEYGKEIEIVPEGLKEKVVPLGGPFSRLWLDQGIWRPLGA